MARPLVPLGEIVEKYSRPVRIEPNRVYRLLGMRSKIGGPFLREQKAGSEISANTLFRVDADDFIYSRLFAWQGSFGVIPEHYSGCHVSNEFPTFRVDSTRIDPRYLALWFGIPQTQRTVEADCFGSTPGTRNRYKEAHFLRLMFPLPPLGEQRRAIDQADHVVATMADIGAKMESAEHDVRSMLLSAFREIAGRAPRQPMAAIAPLVRRSVIVQPEFIYPELGVRSFGKGTFHKPALAGVDVGSKRLYSIHEGDLVFNNVFAWEGAVAVAGAQDHERVGSHRFLTCVPAPNLATPEFLNFFFHTTEGLQKLGEASPGGAGRNRTLGIKKLESIEVPVPDLDRQRWFDRLQVLVREVEFTRATSALEMDCLLPAVLQHVFRE